MNSTIANTPAITQEDLKRIFNQLKDNQYKVGNETVRQRKAKLKTFLKAVMAARPQIKEAMFKDFKKHPSEVDLTDVYPVTSELKHAIRNLSNWLGKHSVQTPLALVGSSSYIKYEPKGVVLIISPWNFPVNLTFGPLASAIAAGNTVLVKPSEHTPHTAAVMKKIVEEVFDENEVKLVEGGIETSQALLKLPFNHIFFTGASSIGKIVMEAAAKNLASVTLELGGKSPTIVDETANINLAAKRIAWAKFSNNGQVCVAPDYVLVHEKVEQKFVAALKNKLQQFYGAEAANESSYARVVNERHFHRVKGYIDEAVEKGATVHAGNQFGAEDNYIAPTLLSNVSSDTKIMEEEIFGPVLPIMTYKNIEEVVSMVNAKEKPLALYIYSKNKSNINYILGNTRAGGGCINNSTVHYSNIHLPFGGTNNSGIGKAHGWHGFLAFSNPRGILRQHIPNALDLVTPPYNNFKQKLIDFTIKYL